MRLDKNFQIAFLVSFITHSLILFPNPQFNLFPQTPKEKKLEVKYIKPPLEKKPLTAPQLSKKEPLIPIPQRVVAAAKLPPPLLDKEEIFKKTRPAVPKAPAVNKPVLVSNDVIAIKKKIGLPAVELEKIDNPSYISYYQLVREKIKRAAYQNYIRTDTGDVYISFIISSDGYLKNLLLNEEKSCPNNYLREISVKSLKDASPFPNFPKELDYPQLSFNVIISFEIED